MIILFPCLSDNYGFLLHDPKSGQTAAIDTPDGSEILRQCDKHGLTLTHVFNTHHHFDHVGGNQMLKAKHDIHIIGPAADADRIPHIDQAVQGGDMFSFGALDIHVIDTPGHTKGHCAYYVPALESAFVGDTLFALGCGRLFEGTPQQMFDSIAKLAQLPDATKIYCAHEYTLSNGAFAQSIDPENMALENYMKEAKKLRDAELPTIPTTIAREKAANPFMRAATADILGRIRKQKDIF